MSSGDIGRSQLLEMERIVLIFLELFKNKRVIMNTEFAVMSSVCACGGNLAPGIKYAWFSVQELRDPFKTSASQLKKVEFRLRRHEKQSQLIDFMVPDGYSPCGTK
jgi:hypothetical protein